MHMETIHPPAKSDYFLNLRDDENLVLHEGTRDNIGETIWSTKNGLFRGSVVGMSKIYL